MGSAHCCGSLVGATHDHSDQSDQVGDWWNENSQGIIDDPRLPVQESALSKVCCCSCSTGLHSDIEVLRGSTSSGGRWRSSGASRDFGLSSGRDDVLSHSSLGAVLKARHRTNDTVRALRQINKRRLDGGSWKGDLEALRNFDHPHVCKCHDIWEDTMNIYIMLDLCKGGNLTDLSINRSGFNESCIAMLVEQMVSAVAHLHDHSYVHSDIRPENFLFESPVEDSQTTLDLSLKLIDFGLASRHGRKGRRYPREVPLPRSRADNVGGQPSASTFSVSGAISAGVSVDSSSEVGRDDGAICKLFCLAPEQCISSSPTNNVAERSGKDMASEGLDSNAEKADIWALGVIAYYLLSGQSPFSLTSASPETDTSFQNARYVFMPSMVWRPISAEAKHFIALCLQKDPSSRPSAMQLLSMPWMVLAKTATKVPDPADHELRPRLSLQDPPLPSAPAILSNFDRMRHFQKIEKGAILAAGFKLSSDSLAELWRGLESRDPSKSGGVTIQDLLSVLHNLGVTCTDLAQMAEDSGLSNSSRIAYSDLIDDIQEFQRNVQDHTLWEVFSQFSGDARTTRVSRAKLVKAIKEEYGKSLIARFPQVSQSRVIKDLEEGEGSLNLEEFRLLLHSAVEPRRITK